MTFVSTRDYVKLYVPSCWRLILVVCGIAFSGTVRAQVNSPGYIDTTFTATCVSNAGFNTVRSMIVEGDGKIVGVGEFYSFSACQNGIFRCDSNGVPDPGFTSPFTFPLDIQKVAAYAGGKYVVAGSMSLNYRRYSVARVNANGALDGTFTLTQTNPVGGSHTALAMAVDSSSRIVVGGYTFVGTATNYLRRLNGNGVVDGTFNAVSVLSWSTPGLNTLAIQPDNKIIIGGLMTNVGGVARQSIARLNENGTLDDTFTSPFASPFAVVAAIKLLTNGQMYVTGQFGTNANNNLILVRLNANGTVDQSFPPVPNAAVGLSISNGTAIAMQPDGKIVFTHGNGAARVNADGVVDTNYFRSQGEIANGGFETIAMDASGRALIGAAFATSSFVTRRGLFRLIGGDAPVAAPPDIDVQPVDQTVFVGVIATFSLTASGSGPLSYNWHVDGTSIGGGNPSVNIRPMSLESDNTSIYCIVTNQYGRATSSVVKLFVQSAPVAPSITAHPVNLSITNPPPVTAGDLTDEALRGKILRLRILGGGDPFPASGAYEIVLSEIDPEYSIPSGGAMPASSGNWAHDPDPGSDAEAVLTLDNALPGPEGGAVSVALLEDGNYEMYADGVVNNQHGTFSITRLDGSPLGAIATFSVTATGSEPLVYQWRRDGQLLGSGFAAASSPVISGANSATLVISNVVAGNAGGYSCVVSNAAGSVTSLVASLSVTGSLAPTDVVAPRLTISTPPSSLTKVTSNRISFSGTATDAGGVAGVSVQRGSEASRPAVGTTAWSAAVELAPGTNLLRFRARDFAGNFATYSRSMVYVVTSPLTLSTNGVGTVNGATNNQHLEIGKSYTLTAAPGAGHVFSNWTGGLTSSAPALNFVMSSNLMLVANFVPIPFGAWAGSYNGLFHETTGGVHHHASGFVNLTLRPDGSFSARLQQGTKKYPFTGKFDLEGNWTNVVKRPGTNNVFVELVLDLHGDEVVTGSVSANGSWKAELAADRATFNAKSSPATNFVNTYTCLIPGSTNVNIEPAGDGPGGFTVDTGGLVKFKGVLADSSPASQTVPLSKNGVWPLYVSLYGGRGSVLGWIAITNSNQPDLGGRVSWNRPPSPTPKVHTNGFALDAILVGSVYRAPGTNTMFTPPTGIIAFNDGNLPASFTNNVTLLPRAKVTVVGTNKTTLTFTQKTGQFTGGTTPPGTRKALKFKGAFLQKQGYGGGHVLGTNQSGRVYFGP